MQLDVEYERFCRKYRVRKPNSVLCQELRNAEPPKDPEPKLKEDEEGEQVEHAEELPKREIDLSRNYVGNRGLLALFELLHTQRQRFPIASLKLKHQRLFACDPRPTAIPGNALIRELFVTLSGYPVESIDLSQNELGTQSYLWLVEFCKSTPTLKLVHLEDTLMSETEKQHIAAILRRPRNPESISASPRVIAKTMTSEAVLLSAEVREERSVAPVRSVVCEKDPEQINLIRSLFRRCSFASYCTEEDIKTLAEASHLGHYRNQMIILETGDTPEWVCVVEGGGEVHLQRGEEIVEFSTNHFFGDEEVLNGSAQRQCTATAHTQPHEELVLWQIPAKIFRNIFQEKITTHRRTWKRFVDALPCLLGIGEWARMMFLDCLQPFKVSKGSGVQCQSTLDNYIFIVLEGRVCLHRGETELKSFLRGEMLLISTETSGLTELALLGGDEENLVCAMDIKGGELNSVPERVKHHLLKQSRTY